MCRILLPCARPGYNLLTGPSKSDVLVPDLTPQRRPVQFSLRKLMLWTVVLAACLSTHRPLLVYLGDLGVPNHKFVAVCLTVYLAALVPVRVIWGGERGAQIAVFGTFFVLALMVEIDIVINGYGIVDSVFVLVPVFFVALFLSAFGFLFVHVLVIGVDRIDGFFHRKSPHDQ